ncbi:NfeD family protein [Oryzifoliimicrobium ureilyticus]|uniref:NfeD family protein n=1 Tax=Oryzifoliimicrobium ureilyticus TaxID=3113724 RepID=UPI003075EED9
MIISTINQLGLWGWWVLGLTLLAFEIVVPGFFLFWIGLAALAVGALSLLLWETPIWAWQVQALAFAALSVAAIMIGRRWTGANKLSDEPFLNDRGASLVGRTAILVEPITNGKGRIRLDDTTWQVMGPNLPAGAQVRIIASHGRDLTVEAA